MEPALFRAYECRWISEFYLRKAFNNNRKLRGRAERAKVAVKTERPRNISKGKKRAVSPSDESTQPLKRKTKTRVISISDSSEDGELKAIQRFRAHDVRTA